VLVIVYLPETSASIDQPTRATGQIKASSRASEVYCIVAKLADDELNFDGKQTHPRTEAPRAPIHGCPGRSRCATETAYAPSCGRAARAPRWMHGRARAGVAFRRGAVASWRARAAAAGHKAAVLACDARRFRAGASCRAHIPVVGGRCDRANERARPIERFSNGQAAGGDDTGRRQLGRARTGRLRFRYYFMARA
jgi:hypothetical protein